MPSIDEKECPEDSPDDIIAEKFLFIHLDNPRNDGCKSTDNRQEAGEDNCHRTVLLEEVVRLVQIFFLEKQGIFSLVEGRSCFIRFSPEGSFRVRKMPARRLWDGVPKYGRD